MEAGRFERGTDGPKVIVAGVDGSPTSLNAGAYAAGLARRQRSRLVVAHVVAVAGSLVPNLHAAMVEAAAEVEQELRAEVALHAHRLGVPVEFRTARGDPFTELSRIADDVLADMVVVGASTQLGHRMVGSVAVRLVKAGRWPVVVVP